MSPPPSKEGAGHGRIALGEDRPQKYRMFYTVEDGKKRWYPLEDPDAVEELRAEPGLGDACFRR